MERTLEFDPIHGTLRDANGRVLKNLGCPKLKSWDSLLASSNTGAMKRHCDSCDKSVTDTAHLTYEEVVDAVKQDPNVCFRVCLEQNNIEVRVRNDELF